jgi:hypothetical protein
MALTGELSDLSLAELIEFFCNQRKTGCLKVIYPRGAGHFYLKAGAVIHARFGNLRGIDAVYYALTQSNASFTFTPSVEVAEHTINQPWTSVVLEGLRRMDEGIPSPAPSAESLAAEAESKSKVEVAPASVSVAAPKARPPRPHSNEDVKAFGVLLSSSDNSPFARRRWHPAMVVAAVVLLLGGVGVPWALYTRSKASRVANQQPSATVTTPTPAEVAAPEASQPEAPAADTQTSANADADELARRQREARARERLKLEQAAANAAPKPGATPSSAPAASNRRATVTVTYDENGRVTAASGGDPTALRIARQKRFPPGKPGSATITIPIN